MLHVLNYTFCLSDLSLKYHGIEHAQLCHNSVWVAAKGTIFEHPHLPPSTSRSSPATYSSSPEKCTCVPFHYIIRVQGTLVFLADCFLHLHPFSHPPEPSNISKSDLVLFNQGCLFSTKKTAVRNILGNFEPVKKHALVVNVSSYSCLCIALNLEENPHALGKWLLPLSS